MTKDLEDLLGRGILHFAFFLLWQLENQVGCLNDRGRFFVCSGFISWQPDKVFISGTGRSPNQSFQAYLRKTFENCVVWRMMFLFKQVIFRFHVYF